MRNATPAPVSNPPNTSCARSAHRAADRNLWLRGIEIIVLFPVRDALSRALEGHFERAMLIPFRGHAVDDEIDY